MEDSTFCEQERAVGPERIINHSKDNATTEWDNATQMNHTQHNISLDTEQSSASGVFLIAAQVTGSLFIILANCIVLRCCYKVKTIGKKYPYISMLSGSD